MLQDDLPEDEDECARVMSSITHVCMDRPLGPSVQKDASKEYIQPQYIVDSVNNLFLLPTKPYQPGVVSNFLFELIEISVLGRSRTLVTIR